MELKKRTLSRLKFDEYWKDLVTAMEKIYNNDTVSAMDVYNPIFTLTMSNNYQKFYKLLGEYFYQKAKNMREHMIIGNIPLNYIDNFQKYKKLAQIISELCDFSGMYGVETQNILVHAFSIWEHTVLEHIEKIRGESLGIYMVNLIKLPDYDEILDDSHYNKITLALQSEYEKNFQEKFMEMINIKEVDNLAIKKSIASFQTIFSEEEQRSYYHRKYEEPAIERIIQHYEKIIQIFDDDFLKYIEFAIRTLKLENKRREYIFLPESYEKFNSELEKILFEIKENYVIENCYEILKNDINTFFRIAENENDPEFKSLIENNSLKINEFFIFRKCFQNISQTSKKGLKFVKKSFKIFLEDFLNDFEYKGDIVEDIYHLYRDFQIIVDIILFQDTECQLIVNEVFENRFAREEDFPYKLAQFTHTRLYIPMKIPNKILNNNIKILYQHTNPLKIFELIKFRPTTRESIITVICKFLKNKDEFNHEYQLFLSIRLLNYNYNYRIEQNFIQEMKYILKESFYNKTLRMFKDINFSIFFNEKVLKNIYFNESDEKNKLKVDFYQNKDILMSCDTIFSDKKDNMNNSNSVDNNNIKNDNMNIKEYNSNSVYNSNIKEYNSNIREYDNIKEYNSNIREYDNKSPLNNYTDNNIDLKANILHNINAYNINDDKEILYKSKFYMTIITECVWPMEHIKNKEIKIPEELNNIYKQYKDLYIKSFSRRRLEWIYQWGYVDIIINTNREYQIRMNLYQYIVIKLLNNYNSLNNKIVSKETKLSIEDSYYILNTLKNANLLLKNKEEYIFNNKFNNKNQKIKLDEIEFTAKRNVEMNYDLEMYYFSLISRVMKKWKELKVDDLKKIIEEEYFDTMKFDSELFIKSLNSLVNKGIIENNGELVLYIP